MTFKSKLLAGVATLGALTSAQSAVAADGEITVGYFLEWPMPFEYAKTQGTYDETLGMTVNWVSFDSGTAMSAAMASGDVQISVSQGVPPFVVATSGGQDIVAVDVAVSYAENDNCVVQSSLEIDASNTSELEGKKVAVPLGTAAHYGFLKQMDHFGVDISTMEVVDMAPTDSAPAFEQGNLDMACGWGGSLRRMLEHGNVLLTGAEKQELGILVFDVTSADAGWASENPDVLAKFLKVTADANAMWAAGDMKGEMLTAIAADAGMDETATEETMATFEFPTIEQQLSEVWLGGGAAGFMKGVAEVFAEAGSIDAPLESYEDRVDTSYLQAASEM